MSVDDHSLVLPANGLSDGSVTVRHYEADDARPLLAGVTDEAVVRFANVPWASLAEEELAERIRGPWQEMAEGGEGLQASIRDSPTDALLGHIVVFGVQWKFDRAEVGFWLLQEARGRGATARAVELVCRWLFDEHGLARIQATTSTENVASQRTLENARFQREGVLRAYYAAEEGSGRQDHVMYSRLADD